MVHRREINGRAVVFGNQGDLWMNAMTWFDHDTGSIWSQPTGEAIIGPLAGEKLELLPSTLSSWGDWKARFPNTLALDKFTRDNGFSIESMAVAVVVDDDSIAIPFVELREVGAVSVDVGDVPVLIVADPEHDRWAAYSRIVDGAEQDLRLVDDVIVADDSGKQWDAALGTSLTGDAPLDQFPAFSTFGSDYRNFYPDGELLSGS